MIPVEVIPACHVGIRRPVGVPARIEDPLETVASNGGRPSGAELLSSTTGTGAPHTVPIDAPMIVAATSAIASRRARAGRKSHARQEFIAASFYRVPGLTRQPADPIQAARWTLVAENWTLATT
jgi:hypothetical protein